MDKDLVASDMSQLCTALSVQAGNVHVSEQRKITLGVTLHGMISNQQVSALADTFHCKQVMLTGPS